MDWKAITRGAGLLLTFAGAWVACGDLSPIEENRCGNGVIEPGEDCDTTVDLPGAESCVGLGLPGQCHYSCAPGPNNTERLRCPDGWGCGSDDICRRHSGQFVSGIATDRAVGRWFDVADFDGDTFLDIVTVSDATIGVDYLENGLYRQSYVAPFEAVGLPSVADADSDGRVDFLAPSLRGVALFRGTSTRALAPTTFASLAVQLRLPFVFVSSNLVPDVVADGSGSFVRFGGDEPLVFADGFAFSVAGQVGYAADPAEPDVNPLVTDPQQIEGRPVPAVFDETPDVHGAYTESPEQFAMVLDNVVTVVRPSYVLFDIDDRTVALYLFDATTEAQGIHPAVPASHPSRTVLTTTDPLAFNRVMAVHANRDSALTPAGRSRIDCGGAGYAVADEHVDLVVEARTEDGEESRILVAYGLGDGTFHGRPCELEDVAAALVSANNELEEMPMNGCTEPALAVEDLDGDGALDVVTRSTTFLSGLIPLGEEGAVGICSAVTEYPHSDGTRFTEVVTADFDGDGLNDVVAANDEAGIDFLTTDGTPVLRRTTVVTVTPASGFRLGDFDGDGVADVAFSEERGNEFAVSVLFGEWHSGPQHAQQVGTLPGLTALEAAAFPVGTAVDAPEDLLIATPEPDTDLRFRFAVLEGRSDRALQAPFTYSVRGSMGQSPVYLPYGAAIAPFDVSCEDELAGDDNPQVLFVTGGIVSTGDPSLTQSIMGSACVDTAARVTVAERTVSSLELDASELAQGTAVIPIEMGAEGVVPVVAIFSLPQSSRSIELVMPTLNSAGGELSWQRNGSVFIDKAAVAGGLASDQADPTSPIRKWAPFVNNAPSGCRLWVDQEPAAVFLAVHDDGACVEGDGSSDVPARTVLHVLPSETLLGIRDGELDGALQLVSEDGATILGYACLNADDDVEEELVVVTLLGPIDQCDPGWTGPEEGFTAALRLVELDDAGGLRLREEPIGLLDASQLSQSGARPPVSGLAAGDFNNDGIDDVFIATPDNGFIWLGRAVMP